MVWRNGPYKQTPVNRDALIKSHREIDWVTKQNRIRNVKQTKDKKQEQPGRMDIAEIFDDEFEKEDCYIEGDKNVFWRRLYTDPQRSVLEYPDHTRPVLVIEKDVRAKGT